jgi:Xaa-Pro aminopeptidase
MAAEKKTVTIIVEGTPHEWPKDELITYAEVVTLEVPDYAQHPEITYSVKYKNGHGDKPEGILSPGSSVKVKEGMVFSVSETGQS